MISFNEEIRVALAEFICVCYACMCKISVDALDDKGTMKKIKEAELDFTGIPSGHILVMLES